MLLLLKNYALAPAFRLKCSVIPVATRHFLTTSPNHSPSPTQKTGDKPKRCESIKSFLSKSWALNPDTFIFLQSLKERPFAAYEETFDGFCEIHYGKSEENKGNFANTRSVCGYTARMFCCVEKVIQWGKEGEYLIVIFALEGTH